MRSDEERAIRRARKLLAKAAGCERLGTLEGLLEASAARSKAAQILSGVGLDIDGTPIYNIEVDPDIAHIECPPPHADLRACLIEAVARTRAARSFVVKEHRDGGLTVMLCGFPDDLKQLQSQIQVVTSQFDDTLVECQSVGVLTGWVVAVVQELHHIAKNRRYTDPAWAEREVLVEAWVRERFGEPEVRSQVLQRLPAEHVTQGLSRGKQSDLGWQRVANRSGPPTNEATLHYTGGGLNYVKE